MEVLSSSSYNIAKYQKHNNKLKGEDKMKEMENNVAILSGEIVSNFEFSHEVFGEGFYTAMLSVERISTAKDIIPIMVSERLVDIKDDWMGRFVKVSGQFRSYNRHQENQNRLILSVFAMEFKELDEIPFGEHSNHVFIDGYVCKMPNYRKTPLGREITDIFLAVNRFYKKSDYIPCIAWGRNAGFASTLEIGTRLRIVGRIQSREYRKKISDDETETRVAYEVSIQKMEVIENGQEEY